MTVEEMRDLLTAYDAVKDAARSQVDLLTAEMPEELEPSDLSQGDLGKYYDSCGTWHETLSQTLSEWEARLRVVKEKRDTVKSYLLTNVYQSAPAASRKDFIAIDSDYIGANLDVIEFETLVELLGTKVSAISRRMVRISRHFTTRMGQVNFADRGQNMRYGGGPSGSGYSGPRGGTPGGSRS